MNHSPRRVAATLTALLCMAAAYAFNIRGTLTDNEGEPLIAATVRLLSAKDSTFVKGTKTDTNGAYTLADIKNGSYIVEGSYIGFRPTFSDVTVKGASVTVKPMALDESSIALKEVTVVGVKTEIKVMEDTVEYNADSYKTQPNAVVEDLLKRLPGVEVDSEGGITANGKTVTKILLDGKEFFADDPKVASKNLPVDMIDKLQVVDRKSDLARLTGVDDGEEETVINLTVKKGMKTGWFGTIEGGYGTDNHYLGQFNVNRFWNDNQLTLLGNFNNINELGFTDSNGNRFRRFGGNSGLTTSQAFGVNFNVGNKEIFRVGGNLMYSHNDRNVIRSQERQYILNDSSTSSTDRFARDRGHNIRADFRVQWKPDSFNTLELRPRLSFNRNDSESLDSTFNRDGDPARSAISRSLNSSDSHGRSFEAGMQLIYNHNFKRHRGRSFSVELNYSHSNVTEDENSYSRNIFYLFNDSIDIYDQITDNHTWTDNFSGRLSWTEPLGNVANGRFLTFAYRLQYRWNSADKMVYDHPLIYPEDGMTGIPEVDYINTVFNDDLSNRFRNEYMNQDVRIGFRQVTSQMNLEAGLSFVPTMSKSEDLINSDRNIPERWVMNYAPFLRYRHRFSKTRSLNIRYNGRSSQPSLTQLQPVPDMADPMNIVIGNPDLKPTFSHSLNLRFQDFNQETQRSIMAMVNAGMTQNSIVSSIVRDQQTGAQTTRYTNVNGVWNINAMNILSMPLRNKAWQVSNHIFANFSQSVGFNNGERNRSRSTSVSISPSIAFRPENLEFEFRPNYRFQTTSNSMANVASRNVHRYGGSFSAYYYTPIGVILNSDIRYSATSGYSEGYDTRQWMWNASISYQMLRDKSLTLSLKAYDILQQRSNISRTETANYIEDSMVNSLTRYFMATISWKFNTFGKGKRPGDSMEGPGGPGRHGGFGGGRGGFGGGRPPR